MEEEMETIQISKVLYKNLVELADNSGFENIDEFVIFVLDEIVRRENHKNKKLSENEKIEIDKNLKELGYKT
jgi:hypothetical protein